MCGDKELKARILIQQCVSASLQLEHDGGLREIKKGIIVYVCFLNGCTLDVVDRAVKTLLKVKLSEADDGKLTSIAEMGGDILLVPQACLGGKLRGATFQYHSNLNKADGSKMYDTFVQLIRQTYNHSDSKVESGIYGQRQILKMDTNGPFSHILEL